MMEIDEFTVLLGSLSSSDNDIRSIAEKQYQSILDDAYSTLSPTASSTSLFLLSSLLKILSDTSIPLHIRQLSTILLRRILTQEEISIYHKLDNSTQTSFKKILLDALSNENCSTLKNQLTDTIGDLANYVIDNNDWQEILPFIYSSIQSTDPLNKEAGICLLGMISNTYQEMLTSKGTINAVVNVFKIRLNDDDNNGRIVISSLRSLVSLFHALREDNQWYNLLDIADDVINTLKRCINHFATGVFTESIVVSYIDSLIEIGDSFPFFFENTFHNIIETVVQVIESTAITSSLRHLLIEFLVSLATTVPKKIRKLRGPNGEKGYFALRIFPVLIMMMCSIEDDAHWITANDIEESAEESTADSDVGETAIDRISQALGLRIIYPIISPHITTLLSQNSWNQQCAGLTLLANLLEITIQFDKNQLSQHRDDVMQTILSYVNNNNMRVRYTAYYALSQFFVNHGKEINNQSVQLLLSTVLQSLDLNICPAPRLQRMILICLVKMINAVDKSILEEQTGTILTVVANSLTAGPPIVQELCVSAIIGLAECTQGNISGYYDSLMPLLNQLLVHSQSIHDESLWGQGLECISILGEASGKVKFTPQALELVQVLSSMSDSRIEGRKYILKAWVRIARCLGSDFLPYLPMLVGQLIASITQDVRADVGELDFDCLDERSDIDVIENEDGTWQAIRTAAVEEQSTSCQLFMLLIEKVQEMFYPYAEQSVQAIAPLLSSPHDDVRSYCLVIIPEIIRAVAKATLPDVSQLQILIKYCFQILTQSIETEAVIELIMTGLQAIKLSILYACSDWNTLQQRGVGMEDPPNPTPFNSHKVLTPDDMSSITVLTNTILRDCIQRRAVLRAEAQVQGGKDDADIDDENMLLQENMELYYNVADVIGMLFKTHGNVYFPIYAHYWHDRIIEMANPICLIEDQKIAFYIISDMIEFGFSSELANQYFPQVIPILHECGTSPDTSIRQMCAYALGVASSLYSLEMSNNFLQTLQVLSRCISMGDDDEPRGLCTDTACGSVCIILDAVDKLHITNPQIQLEYLYGQVINYLPIVDDLEEAVRVHSQFIRLLLENNKYILGNSMDNNTTRVAQILSILLEIHGTDCSNCDIDSKISQYLRNIMLDENIKIILGTLKTSTLSKFDRVSGISLSTTSTTECFAFSPLSSAPIHDLIMRR